LQANKTLTLTSAAEACSARARRESMDDSMRRVSLASSPRIAFSTSRKLALRCATSRRWLAACAGRVIDYMNP